MFQIRFRFHAVARNICIAQSRRANRLQALMDAILYPAQWLPSPIKPFGVCAKPVFRVLAKRLAVIGLPVP
jgi:hypothetical protein